MKKITSVLAIAAAVVMLLQSGCKDDPDPSVQQKAATLLNGTWGNAEVLSAPVANATGTLANLKITFNITNDATPSTFTVAGAPDYFPSGSTWAWTDARSAEAVFLDGDLPVTMLSIRELTSERMTFSFTLNGPVGGRLSGIGEYTMRLTKL